MTGIIKNLNARNILLLLVLLFLLSLPLFFHDQYIYQVAILAGIYMVLTMGMYLMLSETGLVMLGQAGFYAIGAYVAALLALKLNLPFPVTFIAGGLACALVAFIMGLPSLRVKGVYFALVTMSFAEIVRIITKVWVNLTGGPLGLSRIPRPKLFGVAFSTENEPYFLLMVLLVVGVYLLCRRISRSTLGISFRATRDDDVGAASIGINPFRQRMIVFVIGCFITGLAGAFYAQFYVYVGPSNFTWSQSLLVLTMAMIGFFWGLEGCLFIAALLTVLPEVLRPLALYREVMYGILLVLIIIYGQQIARLRLGKKQRPTAQLRNEKGGMQ